MTRKAGWARVDSPPARLTARGGGGGAVGQTPTHPLFRPMCVRQSHQKPLQLRPHSKKSALHDTSRVCALGQCQIRSSDLFGLSPKRPCMFF
jgi:hypothetical protein